MIVSLMVTATGSLPEFAPVDANRDLTMDLNDLILNTQRMADTANHPESFSKSFHDVVRSFRLVSGMDRSISKEIPQGFTKSSSLKMLVVTKSVFFLELDDGDVVQLSASDYPSTVSAPPDPPPEPT